MVKLAQQSRTDFRSWASVTVYCCIVAAVLKALGCSHLLASKSERWSFSGISFQFFTCSQDTQPGHTVTTVLAGMVFMHFGCGKETLAQPMWQSWVLTAATHFGHKYPS
eukprot:scaffold128531_cov13-Tisochrysis_lutea.AAC.1